MKSLVLVERYVLETLFAEEKKFSDIQKETSLNDEILQEILNRLVEKQLIKKNNKIYLINENEIKKEKVKYQSSFKNELIDMLNIFFDSHWSEKKSQEKLELKPFSHSQFKLKKVFLSYYDQVIFDQHLERIDEFLRDVQKRHEQIPMKDKKIIFYGQSSYQQMVMNYLNF